MSKVKRSIFGGIIIPIIILIAGLFMVFFPPSSALCLLETETAMGTMYNLNVTSNGYNFDIKYQYEGKTYNSGQNIKKNDGFFFSYIGSVKYKEDEKIKVIFLKKCPQIMDVRTFKPFVAFFIVIACLILSIGSFKKGWLDAIS